MPDLSTAKWQKNRTRFRAETVGIDVFLAAKKTRPQKSYGHWVSLIKPCKFEEFRLLELTSLDQLPL